MGETPTQTNFNGGEISRRLHARRDLNLYDIALAECVGWVPLPEGGLDACPGTIRVAQAAGPCRLIPFEFSETQGYIIEMSAGRARFYTNDVRIEAGGAPVEVAIPYAKPVIDALTHTQSYDVLYLFHRAYRTRMLVRIDADSFDLEQLTLKNGPFESRNTDEDISVSASGVSGVVTLTSTAPIFAPGDVGGLFSMEADDFGDIASWEPGITVTVGQLLTWSERVYRVVGGSGRTGTVAPIHGEGVEWDGIGRGNDINNSPAGGVQLEYVCDRFGILQLTGYTNATTMTATVLRRLPFTTSSSYDYNGGYYDPEWGSYQPPEGAVTYTAGTWRWRFGSFSDRRGWPTCGVVWNERLILCKDSTIFASVAGDLTNFASRNEEGDISADMAFQYTLSNPSPIRSVVADDKLLILTGSGMFALGPSNQAQGVGPGNVRVDRENNEGAATAMPVLLDGRTLYLGKARRSVIEADYTVQRDRQDAIDLTRYARQIGDARLIELASQKNPNRLVWAVRGDGSLAFACYVPSEQALGWGRREIGGAIARSIASISDPDGELDQLWIAAELAGTWQVIRLAPFRGDGDRVDPPMSDFAVTFGAGEVTGAAPWLANRAVEVQVDTGTATEAVYGGLTADTNGRVALPNPALSHVTVGIPFLARFKTLPMAGDRDAGNGTGKMRRISRLVLDVLNTRGLGFSVQGQPWRDIEELQGDSIVLQGFKPYTGIKIAEDCGTYDRTAQIEIARLKPTGATIRAVQGAVEVERR
jgi:hypothetical protein